MFEPPWISPLGVLGVIPGGSMVSKEAPFDRQIDVGNPRFSEILLVLFGIISHKPK